MIRLSRTLTFLGLLLILPVAAAPRTSKLDNGLTVILEPIPAAAQVAVVVLFKLGGDHDPAGKSGRAHLLEHLYCTAAAGNSPARDFTAIQNRYGRGYNQQTGTDYTVLAGVVNAEQLEEELQDTAARLGDLKIEESDLQREVPRVLSELSNMYGGLPHLAGLNHVRQTLHPIAQDGRHGGNPEQVKALTLAELKQCWSDYYRPNNALLVVAGKFEEAATHKLIEKHFAPLKAGKAPPTPSPRPKAKTGEKKEIQVKPIIPQATGVVSMGYAAPPPGSRNYAAFLFVVSRFYAEIAKGGFKPGLVPPIYYPPLDDPTTVAIQAPLPVGGDPDRILLELEARLEAVLQSRVTAVEKRTAVQQLAMLGTMKLPAAMWARNLYDRAFGIGRQAQLGIDGKALAKAIEAVTDEDLRRLEQEVFAPEKRCVAVVELENR